MATEEAGHWAITRFLRFHQFNPVLSVTSWFVSPTTLLVYRSLSAIYTLIVLVAVITDYSIKKNAYFFYYFTNLSYIGLTLYFGIAAFYSARYTRGQNIHLPKYIAYLFWFLYHTVVHYHIIVPVVFWTFLSKDFLEENNPPFAWWRQVSVHALDAVMMFVELFLNRQVMVWPQIFLTIFFQMLFMFEAFLVYATYHFWVYSFLRWDRGALAIPWYIGLFFFFVICFVIQMGTHKLRDCIARLLGPTETKATSPDTLPMANIP